MDSLAQELVDHIIGFLHSSPRDWPACTLVSRSWVYAAQAHIFRCVSLTFPNPIDEGLGFLATMKKSPHLIQHVRQLQVTCTSDLSTRSTETFPAICNFPFTHLDRVDITMWHPEPSYMLCTQQLLSLPTIRRIQMICILTDPSDSFQMWDRCSPRLAHLAIYSNLRSTSTSPPSQPPPPYIQLESLDLRQAVSVGLNDWLRQPLCPFDFSRLKHLAIWKNIELLISPKFTPALQTIETLDLYTGPNKPTLDLSLFPRLELFRIRGRNWGWIYTTLSTITASSRILKILFVGNLYGTTPEEFDSHLSTLPISPIVEFEFQMKSTAGMPPDLPRLTSRNLVRHMSTLFLGELTEPNFRNSAALNTISTFSS
ncbi:hypothetical protein C8R44DRAFT_879436 [Mycena epipterygia]|nr:hypothetical protein C8R44DRAFT_879436 [Mycena epipterygia]